MGKPSPLMSSFKLSYYTLLNLMRRLEGSGQDVEYVIKRSFQQFQHESSLPKVTPQGPLKFYQLDIHAQSTVSCFQSLESS